MPTADTPAAPSSSGIDIDGNGALGSFVSRLIAGAAKGDLLTQRELRNACGDAMVRHADEQASYEMTATHSVFLARLCAAHGQGEDLRCLGAILLNAAVGFGQRGNPNLGARYVFEALSIYEQLALSGDEGAAQGVAEILAAFPTAEAQAELLEQTKRILNNQTRESRDAAGA